MDRTNEFLSTKLTLRIKMSLIYMKMNMCKHIYVISCGLIKWLFKHKHMRAQTRLGS